MSSSKTDASRNILLDFVAHIDAVFNYSSSTRIIGPIQELSSAVDVTFSFRNLVPKIIWQVLKTLFLLSIFSSLQFSFLLAEIYLKMGYWDLRVIFYVYLIFCQFLIMQIKSLTL